MNQTDMQTDRQETEQEKGEGGGGGVERVGQEVEEGNSISRIIISH